ncbi:conserved exported hypothetical protein [Tenacibaculum litopenaei]|uniref:hypothetical protein n=1 Tax=Tenacibaculum litopenaei TaxID=396016 RepID=UPI003894EEEC
MKVSLFLGCILVSLTMQAQLPYYELPEAPNSYKAGAVVSRLIDGLGFRYYWATEGLRKEDLAFRSTEASRNVRETLEHIYTLSEMTLSAAEQRVMKPQQVNGLSFKELRKLTLENFYKASNILVNTDDLSAYPLKIQRKEGVTTLPFWNQLNGPIADALWHVGQVVSFRRMSGNPFPKGVSLLTGTVKK